MDSLFDEIPLSAPSGALDRLGAEAADCRRCPLWANATQTVFGEGPQDAKVVFVGEQPGDKEDRAGRPFVGPAGQMFDRALASAGLDRSRVYVTNAVKHFKNEPRGKFRLHKTPDIREIEICRFWLDQELQFVAPQLVVALGASAARALSGKTMAIGRNRGQVLTFANNRRGLITVHPSYLLRLPDEAAKVQEYDRFVADLALIRAEVPSIALP